MTHRLGRIAARLAPRVIGNRLGHEHFDLLQRAWRVYGDARYERLATLSVSHLYNLRKSAGYRALRVSFTKTRPVCNPIGVRKPPRPRKLKPRSRSRLHRRLCRKLRTVRVPERRPQAPMARAKSRP